MLFSLIIPLYNADYIDIQIKSIYSLCLDSVEELDVVFVDDGSSDEYKILCKENIERLRGKEKVEVKYVDLWEKNGKNRVCLARNLWVKEVKSDNLVFIDQDTVLYRNYFKDLEAFTKWKDVVIWPYLWYNNLKKNIESTDIDNFIENWYIDKENFEDFRMNFYEEKQEQWRIWEFFAASNLFMKKGVFEDVWGFDEDIVSWGDEDVEFWYRVFKKWYNIDFVGESRVLNLSDKLYREPYNILEKDKVGTLGDNWLRNLKKHKTEEYLRYVLDRYNHLDEDWKDEVKGIL